MINLSYLQPMVSKIGNYTPLKGKRFERLIVLMDLRNISNYVSDQHVCLCECNCGNQIIVSAHSLLQHNSGSCGCLQIDRTRKHGMSTSRFYKIYTDIKMRCFNKNKKSYKNYGARGITCLWAKFENFRDDMYESYLEHCKKYGEKDTTIDRIDVNGNYCRENCRWLTRSEQLSTKRDSHQVDDGTGQILSWKSYCRKYNLSYDTIIYYIKKKGLSFYSAVDLWKSKHNLI